VGDYVTVSTRVKREMVERRELGINTQFLREKFEVRRGEVGALRSGAQSLGDVLRIYTDEAVRLRGDRER